MTQYSNSSGQPIGAPQPDWQARSFPEPRVLQGRYCRLEPFNSERHGHDLAAAYLSAPDGSDWTYMFSGPFANGQEYLGYARQLEASRDPQHYAVIDLATHKAVGTLALMRIVPEHGVMEVGHVAFSPLMKRSRLSTEAHFLLMAFAFDELGYRRYEWKCDSLNAPSGRAALRLGFTFEGTFRQAIVYKGRSRDTQWYSIIDGEWPQIKQGFTRWLAEENFSPEGQQHSALEALRAG